jgi:proton glutamate symport protein
MAEVKKSRGIGLTTQIFLGLFLGILFGYAFPHYGEQMKPIGDMFIRMIKMIVVPRHQRGILTR